MPDDPVSRLEFTKGEIDRVFGRGYSRDHPELTAAVMLSASLDFHGLTLARAVQKQNQRIFFSGLNRGGTINAIWQHMAVFFPRPELKRGEFFFPLLQRRGDVIRRKNVRRRNICVLR